MNILNNILKKFLIEHNCNTILFDYILNCKNNLKKNYNYFVKPIQIETSIKFENNKKHYGRYVITLELEEFLKYNYEEQKNIFKLVHLDINYFKEKLKTSNRYVDIIFGYDLDKGKVYFDEDNYIICYESSGKIKYYDQKFPSVMYVYDNKNLEKEIGHHVRVIDKNNIPRWYAHNQGYTTIYYRPNIELTKEELKSLNQEELKEYKYLIIWFYHSSESLYSDKI